MLTITGAIKIVIDESTERVGDLMLDGGVVINGGQLSGSAASARLAAGDGGSGGDRHGGVDETIDATGCVVTAGLVNAHHHLFQSAFRTMPGTRGVPMAQWLPTMAAAYADAGITAEVAAAAALVGSAEGLLSGVTTVADHHLAWPSGVDTVAIARAVTDAVRSIGGRLVFVRGTARDDPQEAAASAEAIVSALLPGIHGGISTDGMLQLAVGPAGVHSDSRETFELLGEVAARHGLRRRTQANEQVDVVIALERYGRRPIDLLEDWGWLAPDVTIAHLCAVTDDEIVRLAAAGISATHAPGCDLPMGWGIAPVMALRAADIAVGLGTSGGGSNDAGHLFADARLAMQVAPLVGPPLGARDAIGMATSGSAAGLGRPELGHLGAGAAADVCIWDVSGVADAGVADPVAGLLWASPGRRPRHVIVAGRVVVRDYQLVNADEGDITARLNALVGR
jgi:8-oxoguanine deaminase